VKNIAPNVWTARLDEDDWNFSILDQKTKKSERLLCLNWELHRERVQAEAGGIFPSQIQYVPTCEEKMAQRFSGKKGEDIRDMLDRLKRKQKGKLIKPDYLPFLAKRRTEKWRPIGEAKRETWHWIALDWYLVNRHWSDDIKYAGTHIPCPPAVDGSDQTTEIVPFKIPWKWRDEEICEAFRQWLEHYRPKGEHGDLRDRVDQPPPPPAKATGAKSTLRQAHKNLKALAAWRLIQHYKGDHEKAYGHPGASEYLGKAYGHASEWSGARKIVKTLLAEHLQLCRQGKSFAFTNFP
jgi:hypothetical protein